MTPAMTGPFSRAELDRALRCMFPKDHVKIGSAGREVLAGLHLCNRQLLAEFDHNPSKAEALTGITTQTKQLLIQGEPNPQLTTLV